MKNAHYPFELLQQITDWIEKNKPVLSIGAENARREIQKLRALERDLRGLGMDTLQISDKRSALEIKCQASMDPDFEQTILRLKKELLSLSRYIDRCLRKPDCSVKVRSKRLLVRFHHGPIINEKSAVDTFIKTLQQIGLNINFRHPPSYRKHGVSYNEA